MVTHHPSITTAAALEALASRLEGDDPDLKEARLVAVLQAAREYDGLGMRDAALRCYGEATQLQEELLDDDRAWDDEGPSAPSPGYHITLADEARHHDLLGPEGLGGYYRDPSQGAEGWLSEGYQTQDDGDIDDLAWMGGAA